MTAAAAAFSAAAVFMLVSTRRRAGLSDRMAVYLRRAVPRPAVSARSDSPLLQAGLGWTRRTLAQRRVGAGIAGAFVGLLLAQGDLFVAGPGRSVPGLAAAGAAGGVLTLNVWVTTRRERRKDRLKQEVATVADAIALHILAGESVASAIEGLIGAANGVAVDELDRVAAAHRSGEGLPEALTRAGRETVYPEAARLYAVLANAHEAGGRLADTLSELATDYRSVLSRDLTAEGGRRALATYGPILALMVPVTLVFLMYPTLVGLQELSNP